MDVALRFRLGSFYRPCFPALNAERPICLLSNVTIPRQLGPIQLKA
jgi:hypothetical protein